MHIAFILDGNRRWAKSRGLTKAVGHRRGYQNFKNLLPICRELGVSHVTAYVLSTENIAERDERELAHLFREIQRVGTDLKFFRKHNVRIRILGRARGLPTEVRATLRAVAKETADCDGLVCNLAINYGGRDELVRAAKQLAQSGASFSKKNLAAQLDTATQPDPDLLIRTGGKTRLSNFLPWQLAYTELYFTPKMWPEFDEVELQKALTWFTQQGRNFGQ